MSKYLEILFRYRLRFFILLVVLPAEVAFACILLFPHQTASSSLWVDTPQYVPATTVSWNQYLTPAQNTIDAINQIRSTDWFIGKVSADLDANHTFASPGERSSALGSLSTDVVVFASGSHLVVLTDQCPHEPICTNMLNAVETEYHHWLTDEQEIQLKTAIDFYTAKLGDAQTTLTNDQNAVNAYYASHPTSRTGAVIDPQLDQLLRNVEIDKTAVSNFQQRVDSLKLQQAANNQIDSTVFRVLDPPRTTGGRLNALPRKQMLVAAGAAWAFGLAVLFLMAWSDRTTREPGELESILKLPVVVTVPDLRLMEGVDG